MSTVMKSRTRSHEMRRESYELSAFVRQADILAVRAALPGGAKKFRRPRVVYAARAEGKYVAEVREMMEQSPCPEELIAHLVAIGAQRVALGTVEALEDVAREDAHREAEERVSLTDLLLVLHSDAPKHVKLAALEHAENKRRADAACELRGLAEIRRLRENLLTKGGRA